MNQNILILVAFIALTPLVWSSVILDNVKATPCKVTDHKEEGPTELSKLIHQCVSTQALLFTSSKDVANIAIPVLRCISIKYPKEAFYVNVNEAMPANTTEYYSGKVHCPDGDRIVVVGEYIP